MNEDINYIKETKLFKNNNRKALLKICCIII